MRFKFLLLSIISFLSVATFQSFTDLNAAELWNSRDKSKSTSSVKKTYNNHKSYKSAKPSLYNSQSQQGIITLSNSGLSSIRTSKDIKMSVQKPSRLWAEMGVSALENRQADIAFALKREYNIKKRTANYVNVVIRKNNKDQIIAAAQNEREVAKYQVQRLAEKKERLERKYRAIYGDNYKQARKTYRAKSYNNDANSNKPKKLFNTRY